MQHLTIKVSGLVQGVFFRHFTRKKAQDLGITGFVCNRDDGSVFIEAEGDEKSLLSFLEWCSHGPKGAIVAKIEHSFSSSCEKYVDFEIRY